MMVATKISSYKTGAPRFGRKSYAPHDYSCKTSTLSPEELERYRNGEHGGKKMDDVLTKEQYIQLKHEGKSDEEIRSMYKLKQTAMAAFKRNNALVGKFNTHSIRTDTKEKTTTPRVEEETLNIRQEQVNEQSTDMMEENHAEKEKVESSEEIIELESRIIQLEKELNEAEQKLREKEKQHSKEVAELQEHIKVYEKASVEEFKAHTKYYRQAQIFGQLLKESLSKLKFNGHELHPYQEALMEALPD